MKSLLIGLLLCAPRAFAAEGPGDVEARVHYERAVRAEADQQWDEAAREAQAAVDAAPEGQFSGPGRALLERARQHGVAAQEPSSGVGPRVELVASSTLLGLSWGGLAAAAAGADSKGTVALLMVGAGAGLGVSLAASSGKRITQSVPGFFTLGAGYGAYAALLGYGLSRSDPSAGGVLVASMAGAGLGLIVAPSFTGGDAAAAGEGAVWGGLLPLMVEASLARNLSSDAAFGTLLVGSAAGLIAGPILNRSLHFSRGRWNLIGLGGGVGGLFGFGIAYLADATRGDGRGAVALTALGAVGGLALTAYLTSSFGADEPRGTALLHLEDGKLSAGSALAALAPVVRDRDRGAVLRALEGRF